MAGFAVGNEVTVNDPKDRDHGKSGRVVYVQSDGSLLVTGIVGKVHEALIGWPAFRPDQLKHAAA
jgi:hypothetical protein